MPIAKAQSAKQPNVLSVAQKNFGYAELQRGQEEAIRALLSKQDTLVVMPTGTGKSTIILAPILWRRLPRPLPELR